MFCLQVYVLCFTQLKEKFPFRDNKEKGGDDTEVGPWCWEKVGTGRKFSNLEATTLKVVSEIGVTVGVQLHECPPHRNTAQTAHLVSWYLEFYGHILCLC